MANQKIESNRLKTPKEPHYQRKTQIPATRFGQYANGEEGKTLQAHG